MYEINNEFSTIQRTHFDKWFNTTVGVGLEWVEQETNVHTAVVMDYITGDEWEKIWEKINGYLGGTNDKSIK